MTAIEPRTRSHLQCIASGVPGLDFVLGGGLPEYSFNLIAGAPGTGKTTIAQQIAFANGTAARPAIYFTVLGEPTIKMLRYQRQFGFFRPELVGTAVRFVNLSEEALHGDLSDALDRIVREVESAAPGIVIVDSFRTLGQMGAPAASRTSAAPPGLEHFVQRLALHLTTWEVTSFLIGEYAEAEQRSPVFTVADGILWLAQPIDRSSVVRNLQVIKIRGQSPMPGLHTFRITDRGLQVFPRIPEQQLERRLPAEVRLSTGVPGLDGMMGGGIPAGDAVMIAGPTGSGKSTFAMQFASAALRRDEHGVIVVFEEYPEEYLARARKLDPDFQSNLAAGKLRLIYLRPLDLSVDETLAELLEAVDAIGASWVVIDSVSGFEIALAPTYREDFRESLYRLVGALTASAVTVEAEMCLTHSPAPVAIVEGRGHRLLYANPAFRRLHALPPTWGARPLADLLEPSVASALQTLIDGGMASREMAHEGVIETNTGEGALHCSVWPIADKHGGEHAIVMVELRPESDADRIRAFQVDVTQRLLLSALHDQMAAEAAEAAVKVADMANAAKARFLSTMSHELRTPLNVIGGYVELIEMGLRGPVTPAQRHDLSRIQRAQEHLMGLINSVLNYSKLESGSVQFEMSAVDVAGTLRGVLEMLMPHFARQHLVYDDLSLPHAGQRLLARADPEKLRQIFINILSNAIKFTEAGGMISTCCEARDDVIMMQFSDTGRGIPEDQLSTIFDPFVQVGRRLSSNDQGVGLGLSISRDLARAMGGELTAISTLGAGSTFTLTLPRTSRDAPPSP